MKFLLSRGVIIFIHMQSEGDLNRNEKYYTVHIRKKEQ